MDKETSTSVTNAVGNYVLGDLLSDGGSIDVYRAEHRWLGTSVVLKIFNDLQVTDSEAASQFSREAKIAAGLRHPGLTRTTDGGVDQDRFYLVSEYIRGHNTSNLVKRLGPLSIEDACEIGCQVAGVLQYISSVGVIHRDVKPSNIMIGDQGMVYLMNVGIARPAVCVSSLVDHRQETLTFDYSAPEQVCSPEDVTFLADIYSLGCSLYFLLAGRSPLPLVKHDNLTARLLATIDSQPENLKLVRRDVPLKLVEIIHAMMEKDARRRPQTYTQVIQLLRRHADHSDLTTLAERAAGQDSYDHEIHRGLPSQARPPRACSSWILKGLLRWLNRLGLVELTYLDGQPSKIAWQWSIRWLGPCAAVGLVSVILWLSGLRPSLPLSQEPLATEKVDASAGYVDDIPSLQEWQNITEIQRGIVPGRYIVPNR